jgi:hypothetical protein
MRMHMHLFTRLTNGFSKKIESHCHSVALSYMHYNFARVHRSLRVTPAMEAGIAQHVWSIDEIVALTEPASLFACTTVCSSNRLVKYLSVASHRQSVDHQQAIVWEPSTAAPSTV